MCVLVWDWEILVDARGSVFLKPRGENQEKATCIAKKEDITSLAACCLSPSENFLVVASRGEFTIFAKPEALIDLNLYELNTSLDKYSKVKYVKFRHV